VNEVVVVGSVNMDLVVRAPRLPAPGETISGGEFATIPGGKGANQAVASARLGTRTAFLGCLGQDVFGEQLAEGLRRNGVDCQGLRIRPGPTGVALIVVDGAGRNGIVLAPGANALLAPDDVDGSEALLASARVLVAQLEVPLATVAHAVRRAREMSKVVVLNPAPAQPLPREVLEAVDYLVPNEIEAEMLSGVRTGSIEDAITAGRRLRELGARNVIVTLGERGVVAVTGHSAEHLPAPEITPVDTTAAGDTFIGGMCVALVEGRPLHQAIQFAQAAAAISVTRFGAQPSIPHRSDMPAEWSRPPRE